MGRTVMVVQLLLAGLTAGSVYALVGLGISTVYKVSRVLNLAQGEFVTFGALVAYSVVTAGHVHIGLAAVAAVAAVVALGVMLEQAVIRPALGQPVGVLLVITVGVSMLLKGIAMVIWGKEPLSLPSFSGEEALQFAGVSLPSQSLWVIGGTLLLYLALAWFFGRTMVGKAMLATAEDRSAAEMIGIDTLWMNRLAFGLSAAVGAIAGVLVAPITFITYDGGTIIGLKGFIAATIGGMGRNQGAVLGGLFLGLLEALAAGMISSLFKDVAAFMALVIILVLRSGLDKRSTLRRG